MKLQTFVVALAVGLLVFPATPVRAAATPAIHISAKNWTFEPATITLRLNKPVKLLFAAAEGLHGITIPDLGGNEVVGVGPTPSEIVVTPKKLGTFVAHCSVFCGAGHEHMILTIKVVK